MAYDSRGATLLMRIPRPKFTPQIVRKAFDILFHAEHPIPKQRDEWARQGAWSDDLVNRIHAKHSMFEVRTFWEPLRDGPLGVSTSAQYHLDGQNQFAPSGDDAHWLSVWLFEGNFDPTDSPKVEIVVAVMRELVRGLGPSFACLDLHPRLTRYKGRDFRKHAWGAMYYDAAHVKAIGKARLASCAAIIKEEWPDGGMWIQTWANPFIVAKELTQTLEKELGLKQAFGDTEPKTAKKASRGT